MSIPWGASKGDEELGGYHLVWTRDLVQSATACLAVNDAMTGGHKTERSFLTAMSPVKQTLDRLLMRERCAVRPLALIQYSPVRIVNNKSWLGLQS